MAGRTLINPLNNPYFGTAQRGVAQGPGSYTGYGAGFSTGSADGSGLFNIDTLPDYLSFAPGYGAALDGDSASNPNAINPQAFADYLQQRGYTAYDEANDRNGGVRGVQDAQGNIIGTPMEYSNDDTAFWNAAMLAAAVTGANVYGAAGGFGGLGGGGGAGGLTAAEAAAAGDYAAIQAGANAGTAAGASAGAGASSWGTPWTQAPDFSTMLASGAPEAGGLGELGGAVLGNADKAALFGAEGYGALASPAELAFTGGGGGGVSSWIPGISNGNALNIGSNLLNGFIGSRAADKSANALQQAGRESNDLQRYIFDTARADNKPLVDLRNGVLPQIQALLQNPSSIQNDPGYAFGLAEGTKALNNGAAARGMTYSGAQGKALQRYGQDYAGTKLDQSLNRLTNVAGLGQVGSNNNQQAGQQYGQTVGNTLTDMGSARGSAYIGGANSWGNALGNISNSFMTDDYLRRINGGG